MWAIIKKEVRTYFLSPIGYVFVGLFFINGKFIFLFRSISNRINDV